MTDVACIEENGLLLFFLFKQEESPYANVDYNDIIIIYIPNEYR